MSTIPPVSREMLTWIGDYPILRNRTVAISLFAVATISVGLVGLLLIGLAVGDGNYEFVAQLLKIIGGIWLGFLLMLFGIGAVFFGGKMPMEVIIDERGVIQIQRSDRAKFANRAAMIGGLLVGGARGFTAAGAGMLAASRESEGFEYGDLRVVRGNARTGEIRLKDDWHTVMQIFAPAEHYDEAMRRIESGIAEAGESRLARTDIPSATKVLVSLGAVIFGAFLLAGFPLSIPIPGLLILVAITIATIVIRPEWRPIFGWVTAALVAVGVVMAFQVAPPMLSEPGAGLVLGIQLLALGLFLLFGVCAGLGVFNLQTGGRGTRS
ncbi:MAG: hypothetical protein KDN19_12840 [Verrucomicrobiae bacterium]|nr:hypothetical protein [Verrucomicrobiae bacterium]